MVDSIGMDTDEDDDIDLLPQLDGASDNVSSQYYFLCSGLLYFNHYNFMV